jgi:hypothetical protein
MADETGGEPVVAPSLAINGMWKLRAAVSPQTGDDPESMRWRIYPGLREGRGDFGLVGDLSVSNSSGFAGVTIFLEFDLGEHAIDVEDEGAWETANQLAAVYGPWASDMMYDYAAVALNNLVAGTMYELQAPFDTPEPEIVPSERAD